MSSTTVTRGNSHETFYIAPTLTPASVSANTTAVQTFSVPGLQTTDIILVVGFNGNQTAGIWAAEADCLTANVLTIVCTTSVQAVPVGANKITFAAGELTTGPAVGISASGLTVSTSVDGVSAGASVSALVGTVQSASIALATADQKAVKAAAETIIRELDASGTFSSPIVTEVRPASTFYPAEDYHQDYYKKTPLRYKYYKYSCGRAQRLEALWGKS